MEPMQNFIEKLINLELEFSSISSVMHGDALSSNHFYLVEKSDALYSICKVPYPSQKVFEL